MAESVLASAVVSSGAREPALSAAGTAAHQPRLADSAGLQSPLPVAGNAVHQPPLPVAGQPSLPAAGTAARQPPGVTTGGAVRLVPAACRFVLRGGPAVRAAAGAALGLNISDTACRSASSGGLSALWLGPDEQLILTPLAQGESVSEPLRAALSGLPHSLVDVSHRQIALEVDGPMARTVLNAGCPLDLHDASFPIGMCTRTVLAKADIVLWRKSTATFHVEVWRSFADYASRFLAAAARELA